MKILLVGNHENDRQQSMQRYARSLKDGLEKQEVDVELISPQPFSGRGGGPNDRFGKWLGYYEKFVLFPRTLLETIKKNQRKPLLVHICDHAYAPMVHYLGDHTHVITCHDLISVRSARGEFPQNSVGMTGRYYQRMILRGLVRANAVICVSENTYDELVRLSSSEDRKVFMIPNGLTYSYYPMKKSAAEKRLRKLGVDAREIILHVGDNSWYKNRLGVLRLVKLVESSLRRKLSLVMVGPPFTDEMNEFLTQNDMRDSTFPLHQIGNDDLCALYSMARLLLFPSFAEGFGWPIIEAQACGCPVVTSNLAPMTEVGGDAAVYIDPSDLKMSGETIRSVLGWTGTERRRMTQRGLHNSERFLQDDMIKRYIEVYKKILGGLSPLSMVSLNT